MPDKGRWRRLLRGSVCSQPDAADCWGKSRLGVTLCTAAALQRRQAWWVGPDYPTTQIGWRLLTWLAQQIPGTVPQSSNRRIEMPGGGWVQVRSANAPASLRGEGLDLLVIDEAAHIPKFAEVWEQALRPALSDRQGGALFISTPKGHNAFYELFLQAEQSEDWAAYQFPTSANPHIAPEEIEAARVNLPALVFRQEYCHLPDTMVSLADKSTKSFIQLRVGDRLLCSVRGCLSSCSVKQFRRTGKKPIVEVTTECGTTLEASIGHKVFTSLGKMEIQEAKDLQYIFVPRYSNDSLEALARLVGYNLGDGTVARRHQVYIKEDGSESKYHYFQASFYSNDDRDLENIARDLVIAGIVEERPNVLFKKGSRVAFDAYQVHVTWRGAKKLVEAGCLVGRKKYAVWKVPEWILDGTKQVKIEFLASIWGAEGATPRNGHGKAKKSSMPTMSMYNSKEENILGFFEQLIALHKEIGIETILKHKKLGDDNWVFRLYVNYSTDNIVAFYDQIGYRYAHDKERLAFQWKWYYLAYLYDAQNRDKEAKELRATGMSYRLIGERLGCSLEQARKLILADRMKQPRRDFPYFEDWIESRLCRGGLFIKVHDMQDIGEKNTFNIEVDSLDHSYLLADGINNFNCAEFVQLSGAMFRREYMHFVEVTPACRQWVRYWDLAASTKTSADYTAGGKVGITEDGTIVIAHVTRGRWEWPDALRIIIQTARADGVQVAQGVEDVGVQKGMYQFIMREPLAVGLTFRPIPVRKDKIQRVSPWLARAEQGKVVLVRGEWNTAFLDEVMAFPEGMHDDQVDAVSGAVQMLSGGGWVRGIVQ